jgi:hypothetical protein
MPGFQETSAHHAPNERPGPRGVRSPAEWHGAPRSSVAFLIDARSNVAGLSATFLLGIASVLAALGINLLLSALALTPGISCLIASFLLDITGITTLIRIVCGKGRSCPKKGPPGINTVCMRPEILIVICADRWIDCVNAGTSSSITLQTAFRTSVSV